MTGTAALASWKGGNTLKNKALLVGMLAAIVFSTMALGFDAYFSDSQGNKIWQIWEGRRFWVVVDDRELGLCPPGEFFADLVIFDFKTGAYLQTDPARFLEIPNESGIYYWVDRTGNKVWIDAGYRKNLINIDEMEHFLGTTSLFPGVGWQDGNWIYLDEDVDDPADGFSASVVNLPQNRQAWRAQADIEIEGRLENMDTLVLIVAADHDERLIDQDQMKIIDTTAQITVEPTHLEYGCGAMCNVRVQITDPDENLHSEEIEYVPFFLIVNPGSWNPDTPETDFITTFCALKMFGGVDGDGDPLNTPIRWYNIYDEGRFIDYPNDWLDGGDVASVQFYAWETAPDSGVFVYDFGLLENLQALLGFERFESGTTLAFYYLDPNDFDDFVLATAEVYDRPHSETFITDANGIPVEEVRLGSHHGLYVRVYDADANIEACCQDKVVVHLCDPHNEDDSEYWMIDEVSNDSGIFASQAGMPLLPVWDAVGGYQLVFDSWTFEAFNEDSIYARYNSVEYEQEDLNALGDGHPNDEQFPPDIVEGASRHQPWDVSFDLVKVYDFQVFEAEAETHHMRFLDGTYSPVEEIPLSGNLYLEVTDLDQNEQPLMRELIFGGWNKDADADDDGDRDGAPDAQEDSAPIWWVLGPNMGALDAGDSDRMTPNGALIDVFLGILDGDGDGNQDESITGIPETVKIFMWNAQRGTWERVDLRETAVGSGIFRSTTCVLVADARHPGDGNLASKAGDTIFAFYQDPSNHSDISIIQIKVSEGGAAGVTPPVGPQVAFDANTYMPGDTVTVTVTDPRYAGATEIAGTGVLVITDSGGAEIASFDSLPQVDSDQFQVSFVLPDDVALGTITATYTDPTLPTRQAQDTAEVIAAELEDVTGISVTPNPFAVTTTFALVAEPAGAVADEFEITIYDLVGRKVAELSGTGVAELVWDGGDLRNSAYIYVTTVTYNGTVEVFRGFVYINR
jgi:hypothetical protein